jgi:DNA-binding CsgD family transcriptional regulator
VPCEPPALTPRELEVLRHIADGDTWEVTMRAMGISRMTLFRHRRHILEKSGGVTTPNAVWLLRHELEAAE